VILIRSSDEISNKNVEMDRECSKNGGGKYAYIYKKFNWKPNPHSRQAQ
jgi:hypothetical protein